MAVSYVRVINTQLVGQEFKQNTNKYNIINENEDKSKSVKNDSFYQSNQYVEKDFFHRTLNLTSLIDKPDGYLQGKLSDTDDVDYYEFNVGLYRGLGTVSDKYNNYITVTLDHIPEGCDYDLILYDGDGNQVGIGQDNGNGGKSVTVPNWSLDNREYTVKILAKDGSPVNTKEYYHLSFQTQQAEADNIPRQQAKEESEYLGTLRQKLHDGQDVTEETQALRQIREKYEAYYMEQMKELHNKQAAEYLAEGEVFDESRKEELLSKMSAGEELTEQERALLNIFATAQEIDSATASAKLQTDTSEQIFQKMEQSGISPIPSFEVSIGIDGKAKVEGIEDTDVKAKVENILNDFSGELIDAYILINASMQGMTGQERYILKEAIEIEKFLQKATGGKVTLSNIIVENGRIKGLNASLNKLLNDPGQNQTYLDYRADILAIKNYERMYGHGLLGGFSARYTIAGRMIQC